MLVLDVDGVLTNGGLYLNQEGAILRKFNVKDGLGINLLLNNGIEVAFISGGTGDSISLRAKQLGVRYCLLNIKNKAMAIKKLQEEVGFNRSNTLFLGDDLNDIVVKPYVSLLVATSDASKSFIKKSNIVLKASGGNGAVRELVDKILLAKNLLKPIENKGWLNTNN